MITISEVKIWGKLVGAVAWYDNMGAVFEYDKEFLKSGLDLSPIVMPLSILQTGNTKFSFKELPKVTFRGLPGLLADSLPDRFGNAIIDRWIVEKGIDLGMFNAVERLCYTGQRGMGALEFYPVINKDFDVSSKINISELVDLASRILNDRNNFKTDFSYDSKNAMLDILRVATSAGGARPKAIIAINEKTKEVRSGQVPAPEGFTHWLLKFDGTNDNPLGDPKGYSRIEYAYHLMAKDAGINMTECRLFEEGDRSHFLTKRFDRIGNEKLHLQTLCALAHYDYKDSYSYSYNQVFQVMRKLGLPYTDLEQMFRRMVFNLVARNPDDHTKNISFLMDKAGKWSLSPAYDVSYAFNPDINWTYEHQLSVNGKRNNFTFEDIEAVGKQVEVKNVKAIVEQVIEVVSRWPDFALEAGIKKDKIKVIGTTHILRLCSRETSKKSIKAPKKRIKSDKDKKIKK